MARIRQPGWWYPWIFVGGMLVVIAVNAVLVVVAVGTFSGFETEGHYRKGLAYNDNLAAAEAQAARGWTMRLDFRPAPVAEGGRLGDLVVRFADRAGQPLDRLTVEALFTRPTHAGHDRRFVLHPEGDGGYRGTIAVPLPGQWDVRVIAGRSDQHFQAIRRLVIP